jgi:endogenous inhibitor of DNA gyrase (YacG/DUF329 family)
MKKEFVCLKCGKKFIAVEQYYKKRKFCSEKCMFEYKRIERNRFRREVN